MYKEFRFLNIRLFYEKYEKEFYKKRILFYKKEFNINCYHVGYKLFNWMFMTSTFYAGFYDYTLFKKFKIRCSRKKTFNFLLPILFSYLKEKTNEDKLDIIPLFNRSGETFLICHHLKYIFENNNINSPIFVAIHPYLKSIVEMFYQDINFYKIPNVFWELYFAEGNGLIFSDKYKYYNQLSLQHNHFMELETKLQKGKIINFYTAIKERLDIKKENTLSPQYSNIVIESAKTKMKLKKKKKPFVFISPDAQSNGTCSKEFWDRLPIKLSNLGYDMYFNSIPWNIQNSYYKHCNFSLAEARYVAEQADVIIGVRSGLMDVITNKTSKIICIYHAFWDRGKELPMLDANKVLNGFSLKYLPNVNKNRIFEYNGQEMSEEEIMKSIIKNIKVK